MIQKPITYTLKRTAPAPVEYFLRRTLTRDDFGIHYVRWPYDPALSPGGAFTSANPSRWQAELGDSVGWFRAFDPNLFGRYQGGAFVKVGDSAEATSYPYGRMEGGQWFQGMLRSDGSYDFSKLDLVLAACAARNLKLLMSIGAQGAYWDGARYLEYPLPTGEFASLDPAGYQRRLFNFLCALFDYAGDRIAALELANEPGRDVRRNTVVGPGYTEQLVVACRLATQVARARGLKTLILSPPMQGGESAEITAFLKASALGISVYGLDGAGTVGRDWIDVVSHHNYGNFSDRAGGGSTAALDAAGINTLAADAAYPNNTTFVDMALKAKNVRAAATAGGWPASRPIWTTELHVTGQVSANGWFPRKMTKGGMKRVLYEAMVACFTVYEKFFLYAADHPTLGLYDETGTPPAGEPADWYFKAPDNTARGAEALAEVIADLTSGELVIATTGAAANPCFSVSGGPFRVSSVESAGLFV